MTPNEWADLISAIAKLMWPVFALGSAILFRKPITDLLGRLRKGKVFGQELELDESIDRLRLRVEHIRAEEPRQLPAPRRDASALKADEGEIAKEDSPGSGSASIASDVDDIIKLSSSEPTAALLRLSETLDREIRVLAVSTAIANAAETSAPSRLLPALVTAGLLTPDAAFAYSQFRDLRNQVVHRASTVSHRDLFRIIDIGIELLKAIRSVPAEIVTVENPGFTVYTDSECTQEHPEIRGISLRYVAPGMAMVRIWGVSKLKVFVTGQLVTKEWDCDKQHGPTWYIDEQTQGKKLAWTGICEFVGKPIEGL